ncbi:MAG: hypothetical protein FJX76_05635 [Armatimonadetes bacterium]|nr:hypothetical protein [Armatimonadota bacterium]
MQHHVSAARIAHLEPAIAEISPPLEEALRDQGEERKPLEVILDDLTALAVFFSAADDDISEKEAAMISDIRMHFAADKDSAMVMQIIMKQAESQVRERFGNGSPVPLAVRSLERRHGAAAETARGMFFRFVNGIVKADGRVTDSEEALLADSRKALYQPAAGV